MKNLHKSVMIKEIISFLPLTKSINVIDATFGGGGYSKTILKKFNVNQLLAIDRDPISKIFAKEIESKFSNFILINDKFSKIEELVNKAKFKDKKFDIILFDIGTSSNQIDNAQRGFSFNKSGPLDMQMGSSEKNAFDIINKYEEKNLADISKSRINSNLLARSFLFLILLGLIDKEILSIEVAIIFPFLS